MSAPPPAEGPYPLPYTASSVPRSGPEPAAAEQHPPGPPDPAQTPTRAPEERRWLAPTCAAVIAGVLGIFGGIIFSPAPDPAETSEYLALAGEYDQLADERDRLSVERDGLDDELGTLRSEQDELVMQVEQRESDTDDREAALDEREAGLDVRGADLDDRSAALDEREGDLEGAEEEAEANTITEGVWTVGTDIRPGTYRTTSAITEMCYWGIYRTGTNMEDIIQNDIVTGGRPTVTLSEGQDFETSDCGQWRRQ